MRIREIFLKTHLTRELSSAFLIKIPYERLAFIVFITCLTSQTPPKPFNDIPFE